MATETTILTPTMTDAAYAYLDWDVQVDGERYLVVNEDGADGRWELYQFMYNGWAPEWHLIGVGTDIDTFVQTHALVLAAA